MASEAVEDAIFAIGQIDGVESRIDYASKLPRGIRARVIGELLDQSAVRRYTQRLHGELVETLRAKARVEQNPINPWAVTSY